MCIPRVLLALALVACGGAKKAATPGGGSPAASLDELMKARNLSETDVAAALKTYTPTGRHDEYYLFGSGGHSGQVVVIGVPSMAMMIYAMLRLFKGLKQLTGLDSDQIMLPR